MILTSRQESTDEALHCYTFEKARAQVLELEQRLQGHEDKYGCSFGLFADRTATDEGYVQRLDASPVTQQWEGDLISWEFDVEALREWRRRLADHQPVS